MHVRYAKACHACSHYAHRAPCSPVHCSFITGPNKLFCIALTDLSAPPYRLVNRAHPFLENMGNTRHYDVAISLSFFCWLLLFSIPHTPALDYALDITGHHLQLTSSSSSSSSSSCLLLLPFYNLQLLTGRLWTFSVCTNDVFFWFGDGAFRPVDVRRVLHCLLKVKAKSQSQKSKGRTQNTQNAKRTWTDR